MAVNALQYIKNVGKSFGYSAIDTFKQYNPQITALASGAKELSSDLYDSISDFKANIKSTDDGSEKNLFGKGRDAVKDLRTNLFDDLKTGNWYNKRRIEQSEEQAMKEMFGFDESDFDLDNLDDWDFDFDDEDEESSSASATEDSTAIITSTQKETANAIINSMDAVGSRSVNAIAGATVKSADYIAASEKQSSRALYSLNQKGFAQMSTGLAAINANIASLVTLGEPLTTHMQNSATFYTQSAEYQKSVLEKLDTIAGYLAPEDTRYTSSKKTRLGDVITAEGVVDLPGYFNMVKDNIKSMTDEIGGMVEMMGGLDSIISMATSSPMKLVTSGVTNALIPNIMKQSMEAFNKSLESFFPAALDKLQSSNLGIFDMFKDLLFPKRDTKNSIDVGNYNKGKVNWTGESEMALKEVIPTYLAAITSALTGGPMTHYDYKSGQFITQQGVKNINDDRIKRAAQNAGGNFRSDAISAVKGMKLSKEEEDYLMQGIENYFLNAFQKGSSAATKINKNDFNYKDFGMNEESLVLLRAILQQYEKQGATHNATQFASNIRLGQERYADELRAIEAEGGVDRALYNNSSVLTKGNKNETPKAGGIFASKDEYNNDVFFYLRGIWESNYRLADNMGLFGANVYHGGTPTSSIITGAGSVGKAYTDLSFVGPRSFTQGNEVRVSNQVTAAQNNAKDKVEKEAIIPKDVMEKIVNQNISFRGDNGPRTSGERKLDEANKRKQRIEDEKARAEQGGYNYYISPEDQDFLDRMERGEDVNLPGITDKFHLKIRDNIDRLLSVPGDAFAKILRTGEESLYHLIYGGEGSKEKGLFGYFYEKADKLFDTFDKHFQDKLGFSLKEWAKNFVGDKFGGIAEDTKKELINAKDWFTGKAKNIIGIGETKPINNGAAARGRKVTKTGIVAVSEGEMIIPSEYNPYYHGTSNKRQQLHNENEAIRRFYGSFANGGTVGTIKCPYCNEEIPGDSGVCPYCGEIVNQDILTQQAEEISAKEDRQKEREQTRIRHRNDRNRKIQEMKNGKQTLGGNLTMKDMLYGSVSQLYNGISDFAKSILPGDEKKEGSIVDKVLTEQQQQAIKDANIPQEAISNRGAMGAGALIGAGASLLTGAVLGPFAGAAIGAGVGLVVKSDAVQKALFGDVKLDEDGNAIGREGGLLSENVANFMTKEAPAIGVGAGIGAVGGLFMGSPILGAFVGGAIGFATKSDAVKNALFGELDENGQRMGGIISKDLQDKIKSAMPNIGAGALAGLIAGPFGLVGNVVVGSAIGYASTTDEFKDMILGKVDPNTGKRNGGVVGDLRGIFFGSEDENGEKKQGIVDSVIGIFQKVGNEVRIHSRQLLKNATSALQKALGGGLKNTFTQWLQGTRVGRAVGGAVRGVGRAAYGVATAPLRGARWALERADTALGRRALKRGYNISNRNGEMMTAEERQEEAIRLGAFGKTNNKYYQLDETLAGVQSQEELDEIMSSLNNVENPSAEYTQKLGNQRSSLARMLQSYGVDANSANAILRAVKKEDTKAAQDLIDKLPISNAAKEKLTEAITQYSGTINERESKIENSENARQDLAERLGLDIEDLKPGGEIDKIKDLVTAEGRRFKVSDEEKRAKREEELEDAQLKSGELAEKLSKEIDSHNGIPTYLVEKGNNPTGEEGEESSNPAEEAVNEAAEESKKKRSGRNEVPANFVPIYERWKAKKITKKAAAQDLNMGVKKFSKLVEEYESGTGRFAGKGAKEEEELEGTEGGESEETTENLTLGQRATRFIEKHTGLKRVRTCPQCKEQIPYDAKVCPNCGCNIDEYLNSHNPSNLVTGGEEGEEGGEPKKKTIFNMFGDAIQKVKNKQGEWVDDLSDQDTKESLKANGLMKTGLNSLGSLGATIGGAFNGLKDVLFGDGSGDEKKQGLMSKLFDKFFGEGSFTQGIFGFISKLFGGTGLEKIGKGIKNALKSITPGMIAGGALIAGLVGAFTGKFDDLVAKITGNRIANHETKLVKDAEGVERRVQLDENGEIITNEEGQYLLEDGTYVDAWVQETGSNNSLSSQLKENLVTGTLMGTGSAMVSGLNKGVKMLTKGSVDVLGSVKDVGVINTILSGVSSALECIPSIMSHVPFLKKFADHADDIVTGLYETIANWVQTKAQSGILQKMGSIVSTATTFLKPAIAIGAAINGYGEAEMYFEVKKATIGQKIIAAFIAAINALIPIVGNLIPNKVIIEFFTSIASKIGLDMSGLEEQQRELQEELDEYNRENGTDLTTEEYQETVLHQGGIVRKVKNFGKSIVTNIKEKGIIGAAGEGIKSIGNGIKNTASKAWSGVKNFFGFGKNKSAEGQLTDEQVEELQAEADAYNEENGTTLTLDEYLAMITENAEGISNIVNNGTNALGNLFTRKGLASVSSGELIVSAKDNPIKSLFGKLLSGGDNVDTEDYINNGSGITSLLGKAITTVKNKILSPFDESNIRETLASKGLEEEQIDKVITQIDNIKGTPQVVATKIKDIISKNVDENGKLDVGSIVKDAVGSVKENGIVGSIKSFLGFGDEEDEEELEEQDESLQDEAKSYNDQIAKIKEYAKKGELDKLLKAEYKPKDNKEGTMTGLFKGMYSIQKLYYTAFGMIADPLGVVDDSSNGSSSGSSSSSSSSDSESASDVVEESTGGFFSKIKKLFTGKGSGLKKYSGGDSGIGETFVSQDDSKYRNMKFGDNTVGNIGCGPAAATMMINSAKPGSISMKDAVKYANGYQNGDGTTADYFENILSDYDLPADYIDSTTEKGQRSLRDQVKMGRSTILLGRDSDNVSKARSPFGPSSHYVVATGTDASGNIIINDPESNKAGIRYKPSILNNVSLGISAGDISSEATDNYSSEVGGAANVKDNATTQAVWGYLTSRGYSPAAAAGIMGNMYQESGVDPTVIQGNGSGPAAGIVQWESWKEGSKRWKQMNDYAHSRNKNWQDLDSQLRFMDAEFTGELKSEVPEAETWVASLVKNRYGSINGFKTLTDYKEATKGFEETFEQAGKPAMETRYDAAKKYYDLYNGSAYTGKYNGSVAGDSYTAVGNPNFTKYNLTDAELTQLANLAQQEQGTAKGAAAEASLMANRYELHGSKYSSLNDYVRNANWFAHAAKYMDNGPASGSLTSDVKNAVNEVLVNGKRTIPGYVDEHDCWSDLKLVTNNGTEVSPVNDRTKYQKDVTRIQNNMGGDYTFFQFPDTNSDPFGYTADAKGKVSNDGYYEYGTGNVIGGTGESGSSGTSEGKSSGGVLDTIKNAFKSAFAPLLGSDDSSSSSSSTTSSSGSSTAGGPGGEGNAQQQELVNVLMPYVDKLTYSQSGPRNPEKGSADCSSTVNWAYKKVLGESVGDNTEAMLNSSKTTFIDEPNPGIDRYNPGSTSAGPNKDNLMPGDLMLYTRYNSSSGFANGRPYDVGHVEMYMGGDQKMGHGSTPGPSIKAWNQDAARYIGAKRYNGFLNQTNDNNTNNTSTTSTTDTTTTTTDNGVDAITGAGSGLPSVTKMRGPVRNLKRSTLRRFSGGASGNDDDEEEDNKKRRSSDSSDVISLLKKILKATQAIADNTDDMPELTTTLTNYCKSSLTTEIAQAEALEAQTTDSNKVEPKDDVALQDLMATLGAIAQG